MIPNANSYCEIDTATVDQWGIPVLRLHFRWSEHEIKNHRRRRLQLNARLRRPQQRMLPPRICRIAQRCRELLEFRPRFLPFMLIEENLRALFLQIQAGIWIFCAK